MSKLISVLLISEAGDILRLVEYKNANRQRQVRRAVYEHVQRTAKKQDSSDNEGFVSGQWWWVHDIFTLHKIDIIAVSR